MAHNDYVGRTIDGTYKVVRFIGRGGIGAVFFARHVVSDAPAAIKFLHSQFAEKREILETFYREAQTSSAIGHPNIVSTFDAGISEAGEPYIAMEYLDGESLASFLSRSGPVSLEVTCAVIESVLLALEAAHAKGVVHLFLKPENIFIVQQDKGPPVIKIVDFGISKLTNPDQIDLTRYGVKLGTPEYMAPELIKGGPNIDQKADLYSVGVLMYKMLTGKIPFKGNHYHEILIASTSYPPLPPIEANSAFPLEAEMLIMRCLEKSPQNRPEDAREVLLCIKAFSGYERRHESLRAAITNLTMGTVIGKGSTVIGDVSSELISASSAAAAQSTAASSVAPNPKRQNSPAVKATPRSRKNSSRSSANRSQLAPSHKASRTPARAPQSVFQQLNAKSFWRQKKVLVLSAVAGAVILLVVAIVIAMASGKSTDENLETTQSQNLPSDASDLNSGQLQPNNPNEGASSGNIQIEVRGLPKDAKILYDGIPVPFNPFKVSARESIVPMRVEAPGYQPFVTSVVPSEDQVVVVSMDRIGAAPVVPANDYIEEQPLNEVDLGIQPPPPVEKRSAPSPVLKRHRGKPKKQVIPAKREEEDAGKDSLQKNRDLIDMSDIYD